MPSSPLDDPRAPPPRVARALLLLLAPASMMFFTVSLRLDAANVTAVTTRLPELAAVDQAVHTRSPSSGLIGSIRAACRLCSTRARVDVHRLRSFGPAYSSIVVSHALRLLYVPVFKVATTATMWHIAFLEQNAHVLNATGAALDVALHDMAHPAWRAHAVLRWPDERIRDVLHSSSYLKFGFVRNPYHRLVSAYVDKILRPAFWSFEYQSQMYSLFGNDRSLRTAANITKPTFQQFVTTIASVLNQPRARDEHQRVLFEDNNSRRDLHWRPQVELLHPDIIPFDFIGSFDNLENDRHHVLQWMYQHTHRRIPQHMLEKRHATDPVQKAHFYDMIRDNDQLRQLIIHTYKQDFETFNFSTQPPSV